MQSAPKNSDESQTCWPPIHPTMLLQTLHSLLVSQGRIEGKMDALMTRVIGPTSLPMSTATPARTRTDIITLLRFGKLLLEHIGPILRFLMTAGPYVMIAARVIWRALKPYVFG